MLLAMDIGNSRSHFALFQNNKIIRTFNFQSDSTGHDEFLSRLYTELSRIVIAKEEIRSVIISSVVPAQSEIIERALREIMSVPFLSIDATLDCGITFLYDDLRSLGPDRVCCSVAAYELTGGPVIAVDAGTAITFDCIDRNGTFTGGAIMPGFKTLTAGLACQTARLPEVDYIMPSKFPATNTVESVQCGIVYGLSDAIDGMLRRMTKKLGDGTQIFITGGDAERVIQYTQTPMRHEPELVFHGLCLLAKRFHLISAD